LNYKTRAIEKGKNGTSGDAVVTESECQPKRTKIPTTFVPLSPELISLGSSQIDLLCGVFHIMWQDMPKPRSYGLKLMEGLSFDGDYLGCALVSTFPKEKKYSLQSNLENDLIFEQK
jgi:hypothetical protein